MTIERFILSAAVVLSAASVLYIPKGEIRKALLAFLVFHTTTWIVSIALVQVDLIQFPLREFSKATGVVFIPQFFIYPVFFTWFYFGLSYKPSRLYKALHWLISVSLPVFFAYFIAVYTGLSQLTKGSLVANVIYFYTEFGLQYLICFLYMRWFYSEKKGR
jgi:hypothetical protein